MAQREVAGGSGAPWSVVKRFTSDGMPIGFVLERDGHALSSDGESIDTWLDQAAAAEAARALNLSGV